MASEPLSHTSNCKQEARVGVFFPQKVVFRCWPSKTANWKKAEGQSCRHPLVRRYSST